MSLSGAVVECRGVLLACRLLSSLTISTVGPSTSVHVRVALVLGAQVALRLELSPQMFLHVVPQPTCVLWMILDEFDIILQDGNAKASIRLNNEPMG